MSSRSKKGPERTSVTQLNRLNPPTPALKKTINTGAIGQILRIAGHTFPMNETWVNRTNASLNNDTPIIISPDEIDSELDWLKKGLQNT